MTVVHPLQHEARIEDVQGVLERRGFVVGGRPQRIESTPRTSRGRTRIMRFLLDEKRR
jgi:hypothetical protein